MKVRAAFFVLIVSLTVSVLADGQTMNPATEVKTRIDNLVSRLSRREVARVEVLEIPPGIMTRTRITPEMLRQQYVYKLTIRDLRNSVYEEPLRKSAESLQATSRREMADLRWGLILFSSGGNQIEALYFDGTGNYGSIGDNPVEFKGRAFGW